MSKAMEAIPKHDRPREKLLARGPGVLSDRELIAVLLGKGTRQVDVMTLATKLIKVVDEKGLDLRAEELARLEGVGDAKAALVVAAIEFARRRIKPDGGGAMIGHQKTLIRGASQARPTSGKPPQA